MTHIASCLKLPARFRMFGKVSEPKPCDLGSILASKIYASRT